MALEYETRYFLEHKALPQALHTSRAQLLSSLLRGRGQAMIDFYKKAERGDTDALFSPSAHKHGIN